MSNQTTINLPHGAIEMLVSVLSAQGWTAKRREITAAGMLVENLELLVDSRPVYRGETINNTPTSQIEFAAFRKEVKAWERAEEAVTLSDSEFQACTSCLKHFSDDKKIPATFFGAKLLTEFKLTE